MKTGKHYQLALRDSRDLWIWVVIGLLFVVSFGLVVSAIPADGPTHTSSPLDFASHYKSGVITTFLATLAAVGQFLRAAGPFILQDPYVLINLIPLVVGLYGMYLAFVAMDSLPAGHAIGDDLNFNRGSAMIGFLFSFFFGGMLSRKRRSTKKRHQQQSSNRTPKSGVGSSGAAQAGQT